MEGPWRNDWEILFTISEVGQAEDMKVEVNEERKGRKGRLGVVVVQSFALSYNVIKYGILTDFSSFNKLDSHCVLVIIGTNYHMKCEMCFTLHHFYGSLRRCSHTPLPQPIIFEGKVQQQGGCWPLSIQVSNVARSYCLTLRWGCFCGSMCRLSKDL